MTVISVPERALTTIRALHVVGDAARTVIRGTNQNSGEGMMSDRLTISLCDFALLEGLITTRMGDAGARDTCDTFTPIMA
jgi:hypothetical protein